MNKILFKIQKIVIKIDDCCNEGFVEWFVIIILMAILLFLFYMGK